MSFLHPLFCASFPLFLMAFLPSRQDRPSWLAASAAHPTAPAAPADAAKAAANAARAVATTATADALRGAGNALKSVGLGGMDGWMDGWMDGGFSHFCGTHIFLGGTLGKL